MKNAHTPAPICCIINMYADITLPQKKSIVQYEAREEVGHA